MLRLIPAILAGALLLAACGDDDTDTADAAPPPDAADDSPTEPGPDPDDGVEPPPPGGDGPDLVVGVDACDLLDPEFLAATVTFEFGDSVWEEQPDADPARCRWFNESTFLTLSVTVDTPERSAIDDRRVNPPSPGTNEDLDTIPGAFAVRDDFGERYYQAWIPVDGVVVSLIADVMQIDDDQFVAVAAEVHRRTGG